MCTFIVWYNLEYKKTSQFTALVLECFWILELYWSYSQSLQLNFFVPPGTHHCWVDRGGMVWNACLTPLHIAGSVTRTLITHPSTNRAWRCLTSIIWPGTGFHSSIKLSRLSHYVKEKTGVDWTNKEKGLGVIMTDFPIIGMKLYWYKFVGWQKMIKAMWKQLGNWYK